MALSKLTDIRKSLSVEVEDLQVNGITTFTNSVSIGGTLTYQDVTNIDSVGIITARSGINCGGDLDITGQYLKIENAGSPEIQLTDTNANNSLCFIRNSSGNLRLSADNNNVQTDTSIRFLVDGGEKARIKSNGNMGIGTDNPSQPLDVRGDIIAYTSSTKSVRLVDDGNIEITNNNGGIIDFKTADNEDFDCRIRQMSNGLQFMTGGNGSTDERLRIHSDGRISVGTTTFIDGSTKFEISGKSANTSAGGQNIHKYGSASAFHYGQYNSTGDASLNNQANANLSFATNNTEKITITSAGNLGIGITNPAALTHIYDSTDTSSITEQLRISGGDRTADNFETGFRFYTQSPSANGNRHYRFTSNGNTGLTIQGHETSTGNAAVDRNILLCPDGGKVGIATDTPSCQLHVEYDNAHSSQYFLNTDAGILVDNKNGSGKSILKLEGDGAIVYGGPGGELILADRQNERLRIHADGEVTKPSNPMFKVQRTSNQTVSSNGWHIIQFNNDSSNGMFDVGGNFTTSDHRFTAPVTGYYHFGLNQRIDGGNSSYFRVAFSLNGSVNSGAGYPYGHAIYRDVDGFQYYSFSITTLIYMTAGQYVRAEAYSHSDTSWTLQDESIFYGYLVG